jgi:beta-lactamase class C
MRLLTSALMAVFMASPMTLAHAQTDGEVQQVVTRYVRAILPANGAGGVAVAMRIDGRTVFFNYGWADQVNERPVTADTLFNLGSLRKVFETTVLAQAVQSGAISLDEPVADLVTELRPGGDIRRVTVGQLATHTSGLLLPQDHPPWPDWGYTLSEFIRTLNEWEADFDHQPGEQQIYTHAGFVLLALALERRLGRPIDELINDRILRPLDMNSTTLPRRADTDRGQLSPEHRRRAVQGYGEDGEPIGVPGDQQGYYRWPGTSQMYSSARDLAVFLTANMGELAIEQTLDDAMTLAHQGVFAMSPHNVQALAWEISHGAGEPTIVEKYGGLNNAASYIGIMPSHMLGIVILTNRGNQYPNEVGRRIMLELASRDQAASDASHQ